MKHNLSKLLGRATASSRQLTQRRVESLSTSVADLFQKAHDNEQILHRYQRFELKLLDTVDFSSLLQLLLESSLEYFQLDAVELWLYDPQSTLQELLDESSQFSSLHFESSLTAIQAFYRGAPSVTLVGATDLTGLSPLQGQAVESVALLPLVRHGVLVGSLHLGSSDSDRFAADKSTDFINHLAAVVAVCVENVVNQERLQRLSMYDMLTRVKNRRAFQLALDSEIARSIRGGQRLALLFVDIDYFKKINDSHGHQAGDRTLKVLAQYLASLLRKSDHVCRYGGEEFALILPDCSKQRAQEVAERIRKLVAVLPIEYEQGCFLQLSLSIGVSSWQLKPEAQQLTSELIAERLVAAADKAVYVVKESGRNNHHYLPFEH